MTISREDVFLSILPDPYLLPIGKVISQWAWTEALMAGAIWKLLHTKYRKGRAVTSHLTAQTKIDMICALARLGRQDKSKLAHFEKEGKHLAAQRNLVAHGYAAVDPTDPAAPAVTFISYHARGKLTSRTRLATPEIIEALAKRIARFNVFLMDMYETALPGMKPSQSKPPKQASLTPSNQRRRLRTIAKQLPPPLGWSQEELEQSKQQAEQAARRAAKQKKVAKKK